MNTYLSLLFILFSVAYTSSKKYGADEGNFQPSANRYYEYNIQSTQPSIEYNHTKPETKAAASSDRLRFGISTGYGNTGNGVQYPNTGISFSPMKVDIGGVALGAIIGLSAVLIIPKLTQLLSGGMGYRSIENDMSSITDTLARIDNTLEQHNIDSSSCMQRLICNYVNQAQKNIANGESNTLDEMVFAVSNNTMVTHLLDGSSIRQAIEMGKQGDLEKCSTLYMKCPITKENILKVVTSFLPA